MADVIEYVEIAQAVHDKTNRDVYGWDLDAKDWVTGTWLGNGMQGGIYQNDKEIICAFKGTMMGSPPGQTIVADMTANVRIALGIIPNQAGGAFALVKAAQEIADGRVVSVTGHSLGGALAQVVGKWCNVPFITFNAPGMKFQIAAGKFNVFKPKQFYRSLRSSTEPFGVNFVVTGDPISKFGTHVGKVIRLQNTFPVGQRHDLGACRQALQSNRYMTKEALLLCGF